MFKVGAPVTGEDFIGRETEIERIVSAIKSGNNISVYGMARIGKTSIIKEIVRRASATDIFQKTPMFFEFRLTKDKNIRYHFFEDLKDFILDKVEEYDGEETNQINSLKRLISRVEDGQDEKMVNHERYIRMCSKITKLYDNDIWIILDEMDYANTAFGSYIQKIRELVTTDRVHVINISRHSLTSIFPAHSEGSNYPGVVTQNIPIIGFSQNDTCSFKDRFNTITGLKNADTIWDSMIKYTGNVPYFLALLSNEISANNVQTIADIAENPYGKYMETLKYWYQSLYSDNMLDNAIKYIEDPIQANTKNLLVFGIIQDGTFSVPWFADYIQTQSEMGQPSDLMDEYYEMQTQIPVLLTRGKNVSQGVMRDRETLKRINVCIQELESMESKIECMRVLNEKNTFVRIVPSVEEINLFDTKIRDINDYFEQLEG